MWWHYVLGYFFSVLGGNLLIYPIMKTLWKNLGWDPKKRKETIPRNPSHPMLVGIIERLLYTSSFLLGKSEFIGIWLVLKVAGGWKEWMEGHKVNGKRVIGRYIFNVFLIGNGLSISYGVVGALLINWLKSSLIIQAIVVPSILIIGTLILWAIIETPKIKDRLA